ncbi:hypothetical protein BDZ94DRAFT_1225130 [Collybia nuda]|uniref:C2H2-type domain-containing protein n=1 Tax=Collybia nuda TaxID=64659 RepID=A0A9P5XYP1_9AGAR|nr:hypothetical protein BDZ94DRAFT_1225130 [Collybia nuda]
MPTFGCLDCSRQLFSMDALFQHCSSTGHSSGCKQCNRYFISPGALEQHIQNSSAHYDDRSSDESSDESSEEDEEEGSFCSKCNRFFINAIALSQHRSNSTEHNWCSVCDKDFKTYEGLNQHTRDSPAHDNWSSDESSDESSEEEEEHFCSKCNRLFVDAASLAQHRLNHSEHNWCFVCNKDFATYGGLNQHSSSSRKHKQKERQLLNERDSSPERKMFDCLFCDREFNQPSAVAMHIESGCHKVTRHQVTAAVHKLKISPTISVNRRLEGPILPPTTIITYSATELAFNGYAYECYLCHKTFRGLKYLNAHLNSPAHDDDEFKCPGKKCKSEFKLVSGLIQHIESGSCGLARFKEVQDQFESLTDRFSRSLKL